MSAGADVAPYAGMTRRSTPVPGLVHRYPDRVLLKPTHTCAVYCRFCFRREMVGPEGLSNLTASQLDAAFEYIAQRPEIWEVIVTGGDPFVLSPRRLADISARLAAIEAQYIALGSGEVVDADGVVHEAPEPAAL